MCPLLPGFGLTFLMQALFVYQAHLNHCLAHCCNPAGLWQLTEWTRYEPTTAGFRPHIPHASTLCLPSPPKSLSCYTVVTLWACGNLPQIRSPKPLFGDGDLHRTVPVGGCSAFLTGFAFAEQASGIFGGRLGQGGIACTAGDPEGLPTDPRTGGKPGTISAIIFKPKRLNMHQPNRPKHSF